MRVWISQHWQALGVTAKQFFFKPVSNFLSVAVIGIAFSFPLGIYTLLDNLQSFSDHFVHSPQISLFLEIDATESDIENINSRLESFDGITSFQFVSNEIALAQLQHESGMGDIALHLKKNPLPHAFIIHTQHMPPDKLEENRLTLQQWPAVSYVQVDSDWTRKVHAFVKLGRVAVIMLSSLLGVALVIVIFNTIRLQILTKQEEIEVSKLIGATDHFIRRPFLYFGALQGVVGALIAWIIITVGAQKINDNLTELSQLYELSLRLNPLSLFQVLLLGVVAGFLGWLGARLSVAQHLSQIEPK